MMFFTEQINYLFNCGEGTQRLCQEHRCRLSKMDHIFLTSLNWKNVGGLVGLILTAQDNGVSHVNIHAPEGIETFVDTVKSFISLNNMKISYPSITTSEPFKDNIMTIHYVPLTKSLKDTEENIDENQYELNTNGKRLTNSETSMENYINTGKRIKIAPEVVCYICEVHPKRGKLLIDKCLEYGIEAGPERRLLKDGGSITKEDGTVIESKDVCEPDGPKTTFIVIECPNEEYINSLVNHPAFSKYQQPIIKEENEICAIFHFTPEEIYNDVRYQNWIEKFPFETEHIIFNEDNTCMSSEAVHKNQYLLHMLHSEIFPLLSTDCFKENKKTKSDYIHRARALQTIKVRPVLEALVTTDIHQRQSVYLQELYKIPDIEDKLKELKIAIDAKKEELNLTNTSDYPKIVMLGTGCSVPSKVRNTSGILLRIDEGTSILLDCGEGTLGQIIRFYGYSECDQILRTIKAIYVSHIHADHHLGLIGILLRRKKLTNDKLFLLVPTQIMSWLNFYNNRFQCISDQYALINNYDLYLNACQLSTSFQLTLYKTLNVKDINTIFVNHCKYAYGIAITLKDDKKIVYSGDTMFCRNLITLGQNCDLLIHEATMDDGRESLAKRKLHSTTSEAINAGKHMNAKFTLLTHFSQRYSKIPAIPEQGLNVGLAYDFMEIKLPQLPLLPLFYPSLKVMFEVYNKVEN
ncbi:ribonuclease Z isoform X2 [Megachile rotundata]